MQIFIEIGYKTIRNVGLLLMHEDLYSNRLEKIVWFLCLAIMHTGFYWNNLE